MERLAKRHPERVALLTTQYRSNELISGWSSIRFYNGLLQADSSVARFDRIFLTFKVKLALFKIRVKFLIENFRSTSVNITFLK